MAFTLLRKLPSFSTRTLTSNSLGPFVQKFSFGNEASASKETNTKEITKENIRTVAETQEPHHVIPADAISGAPEELRFRTVRIYKPSRSAMQSGEHNTRRWRLDFDILEGAGQWENPLMGWASSADYVQALRMKFATKEDAIYFAEKQGWDYYIQEPKGSKFHKKVYADNYKYSPGKLRQIKTK